MENVFIIAIDLGGTSAKLAILQPSGDIVSQWSVPTDISDEGSHIVPNLIAAIRQQVADLHLNMADCLGIGMGTPGTVNVQDRTVIGAYNLNWAKRQNIGEAFEAAFGLPFYLDNDANVAALGEQWLGAGDGASDVVMVTLGTGVGGGIVSAGELLHGGSGAAGEIGHLTIDPHSSIQCTCGKAGCLEALASATGIMNLARLHLTYTQHQTEVSQRLAAGEALTAKDIFTAAEAGDAFSQEVVKQFCNYLGLGISHIINMLNPSIIVLGGGVSQAGEFLRANVAKQTEEYLFPALLNTYEIVLATLGNDAGILGACQLVNLAR